jgi:osmotically-inducible protein OsmY
MHPLHVSDVRLKLHTAIHNALARNPYFAGRRLRVELRDDDVVVSGVLDTYFQKQMAQESLLAIDGIRRVHNDIEVLSV